MKRSDFITGLEQTLYDNQEFDGHNIGLVMEYIEKYMKPLRYTKKSESNEVEAFEGWEDE